MTISPRASDVMKFGSPVKTSREEAGEAFCASGKGAVDGEAMDGAGRRGARLIAILPGGRSRENQRGDSRTIYTINARSNCCKILLFPACGECHSTYVQTSA